MAERSQQKNNPSYYARLGKKTISEREKQFDRQSKMSSDDIKESAIRELIREFIEVIDEDFGGSISPGMGHGVLPNLSLENSKPHMKSYKAPEGSARDKKLDAASAAYKRGDLDTAIRIRDEMEKQARDAPGFKTRKSKYTDETKQPAVYSPVMSELSESELNEKLGASTREALKKKAESHNAPLGALSTVYKKGLGAFYSSGSRPGMGPQQWAMARVNSFLKGGKARQVDAAQWKQVQDFRKNKK